jgi:hypothetical protein
MGGSAALESHSAAWSSKLSDGEKDAIQSYTSSGYHEINGALRAGSKNDLRIKDLDSALSKSTMPETTTVYRGGPIDQKAMKVGAIAKDKGYLSGSLDPGYAATYSHRTSLETRSKLSKSGMEMASWKITVPKGAKAAPLGGTSANRGEGEVLMPRGSKLKVTKIDTSGGYGKTVVHAELM